MRQKIMLSTLLNVSSHEAASDSHISKKLIGKGLSGVLTQAYIWKLRAAHSPSRSNAFGYQYSGRKQESC